MRRTGGPLPPTRTRPGAVHGGAAHRGARWVEVADGAAQGETARRVARQSGRGPCARRRRCGAGPRPGARWRPPCAGSGDGSAPTPGSFTILGTPRGQEKKSVAAPSLRGAHDVFLSPTPASSPSPDAIRSTASPFLQPFSSPDFSLHVAAQ